MIHALLITILVSVVMHDGMSAFPIWADLPTSAIVILTLGPMVAAVLFAHVMIVWCARALARTRYGVWAVQADRVLLASQVIVTLAHAAGVLLFGWLDFVRAALGGDWVLVDEAAACAPAIVGITIGWLSIHAVDRVMDGEPTLESTPAFAEFPGARAVFIDRFRHHILLFLVPIALIGAWAEGVRWILARLSDGVLERIGFGNPSLIVDLIQFAGVAAIIMVMPLVLRRVWSTSPLPEGALRDRLEAMCKVQRVRCRDLLMWHTRSRLLNGAVIGFIGPLRYILLTDALIERLPAEQIEAVMAHELAHVRKRHMPWLIACVLVSVMAVWVIVSLIVRHLLEPAGWWRPSPQQEELLAAGFIPFSLLAAFLVLGGVSRRFERQADAAAARALSAVEDTEPGGDGTITQRAAEAMAGALGSVAQLNHIPPDRFTWRHGSISGRIRALHALVGQDLHELPIDRSVNAMKAVLALGGLVLLAIMAVFSHWM